MNIGITRTVTASARVAGANVVHTVAATASDGSHVPVYRATRRSAHRYRFAKVRWITDTDGRRAVVVDGWTNGNRARADQARVPVRWESADDFGKRIEPGASVTTEGRHGVGQPAIAGVVQRVERDDVVIRTTDGKTRRRSIRSVRRVD